MIEFKKKHISGSFGLIAFAFVLLICFFSILLMPHEICSQPHFIEQPVATRLMPLLKHKLSYSQVDYRGVPLDHRLAKILNYNYGIFIEAGANDGIMCSNTKLFEELYGWRGILIEPSQALYKQLCKNRPNSKCFACALGSFQEDGTYGVGDFDGNLMASFTGRSNRESRLKVPIRSLQSILDECGITHVNLFSLDTEGYELNILKGIDFSRTTFDYFLIEVYAHQYNEIVSFLAKHGYDLVCNFSNYNKKDNPGWDGSHNDYLFKRRTLKVR